MISVGFDDTNVHESYICRLRGKTGNGQDVVVNGLLAEGYSIQSASNYGQPLLDFTVGQKKQVTGALAQIMTKGMTSQTLANSIQVYENETPISMTLPLSFIALRNPVQEVALAERYLLEMKAPKLRGGGLMSLASGVSVSKIASSAAKVLSFAESLVASESMGEAYSKMAGQMGKRPNIASATIAKHLMFPEILISDVEIQDESTNHSSGHALQKTINVTIIFQRTINNTEFAKLFPS